MNEAIWAYILLYLLVFLFGTIIGSFLNVVAWRLPRGESFVRGRSHCPACGHQLAARDLIPLVSWAWLRGRCRYCGAPISRRYSLTEAFTGALALSCAAVFGVSGAALAVFAWLCLLLCLALIDQETMTMPDGLQLALLLPALALVFLQPEILWWERLLGAACSLPLLALALLTGGLGGGDIKLTAVCGLALGWQLTAVGLFCGIICGGLQAVYLIRQKKAGRKTAFPFGPALCLGFALSMLWGKPLLAWYLGLF